MSGEFNVRREVELHATPEQVWEAVATGPGNAAWLFPGPDIEGREGATDGMGTTVTSWDPPNRFAVRTEGEGDWFNALEFVIEGREGGTTLLRYAHSGIFVDDWDNQYDGAAKHTDFYLHTLREYLTHFAPRPAAFATFDGPEASKAADALEAVARALGVGEGVAAGTSVRVHGPDEFDAVIDFRNPYFIGLRTDRGLTRIFGRNHWGHPVGISLHDFTPGAESEIKECEAAWQGWLNGVFNQP
jgi:uncharacterized protein YndB with AHSA1/START domain